MTPEALATLGIIFEIFTLREQGLVDPAVWNVWCRDMDRFLLAPAMLAAREQIELAFASDEAFLAWIDDRQRDLNSPVQDSAVDGISIQKKRGDPT
ncbi:hypothetical protein [Sphingomonas sp. UYP23]